MALNTGISWCEATWNPYVGCTRVSAGCDLCYAILESHRKTANPRLPAYFNSGVTARSPAGIDWTGKIIRNSDKVFSLPLTVSEPTLFFVNSMSDLFHEGLSDEQIVEVVDVMERCPHHTFQVLTKRPNRALRMVQQGVLRLPGNVWMGVSVESDTYINRVTLLRRIPAAVRFISAEPLLGPLPSLDLTQIDMVIVGGESGKGARRMMPQWARDIRDLCLAQNVIFHLKQWGSVGPDGVHRAKGKNGHLLDGEVWHELPGRAGAIEEPEKASEPESPWRSIDEFRNHLSAEHDAESSPPVIRDQSPRLALREPIWRKLREEGPMDGLSLRAAVLADHGLRHERARLTNYHAWALVDLQKPNGCWVNNQFQTLSPSVESFDGVIPGKRGRTKKVKMYRAIKPRVRVPARES